MNTIKNPFLARIRNGENELKVVEDAVNVYINSTGLKGTSRKLGINPQTLRGFIRSKEELLKSNNPELYKRFIDKKNQKPYGEASTDMELKEFSIDILKSLPKKISYYDFINLMCMYRTGCKSSEELIAMANSVGVDVIG